MTSVADLSTSRFAQVELPLPPLAEQHRIAAEVERLLSIEASASRFVDVNLERISRLRRAVLKHAFDGKLVPQDPNDEPASVLLGRLRDGRWHRGNTPEG